MEKGMKRVWLGTGLIAGLVILLLTVLISTCNEVHKRNVKEKGEWQLPEYLKTGGAAPSGKTRKPTSHSAITPVTKFGSASSILPTATTPTGEKVGKDQEPQAQKQEIAKVVVGLPTIQQPVMTTNVGSPTFVANNKSEENYQTSAGHPEVLSKTHASENHEEKVGQHFSDTEFLSGVKMSEGLQPKLYFQTEFTNHMMVLTALGVQKSNLIHGQLGYGFHIRDHLLIPRIGGVFSPDGYRGVSLGFTEQYHHGHDVLLIVNADYTHSLREAHESFAFVQIEGFHKIIGPLWLGGGLELLYEHEQTKFAEMEDLELLAGAGVRIYPKKYLFLYAQVDYDLATLLEHNIQSQHHFAIGNFGAVFLLPHKKKT